MSVSGPARFILLVAACASTAAAEVVLIPAAMDNTLYESASGSLSNGSGSYLFAGTTAQGRIRRGLVAFDVAAALPAGAVITSVELVLHLSRSASASELIRVHRVAAAWGEGDSDAEGEEGTGAPAQPGDATWLHTRWAAERWAALGGDIEPIPSAEQVVFGDGFYSWTSPELTDDVRSWASEPSGHFGWALLGNEDADATAKRFDTREHPVAERRPHLRVVIVPAPPGVACSLALLLHRRPRRAGPA